MTLVTYLANAMAEAALNGLWRGALLVTVVWILLRTIPRMNAATRYVIWCLTLAGMMLLTTPHPEVGRAVDLPRRAEAPAPPPRIQPKPIPAALPVAYVVSVPLPRNHPVRWTALVAGAWMTGAALMVIRLLASSIWILRLKCAARPLAASWQERFPGSSRRTRLCGSRLITSPMAVGFFRPAILMPNRLAGQLTISEFDQVLLHELAHVERRDDWTNLFQRIVEALLFFHPAVWCVGRRLNLEREIACDDWAVARTGSIKPYASCLAKLLELAGGARQPVLATGAFRGMRQISVRIERLAGRRVNVSPRFARACVAAAIVLIVTVVFGGARFSALLAAPQASEPRSSELQEPLRQAQEQVEPSDGMRPDQVDHAVKDAERRLQELQAALKARNKALRNRAFEPNLEQQMKLLEQMRLDQAGKTVKNAEEQLRRLQAAMQGLQAQKMALLEAQVRHARNEMRIYNSNGFSSLDIRSKGRIEFTDNDADVKSISGDGFLSIEKRRGFTTWRLEIRPGAGGRTEYSWSVDGHSKPFDQEGRAWMAETLPSAIRESAIGADARVKRLLAGNGPGGVLDEIARIHSDGAKAVYFEELFAAARLDSAMLQRAAREVRRISSDGEKARVLSGHASLFLAGDAPRRDFFDAVATISSDGEHRRVLGAALEADGRNRDTMSFVLRSAGHISSDGEKAAVLTQAVTSPAFDNSVVPEFINSANTISSDGEHSRVLLALLDRGSVSADSLGQALHSAARISSDGEKAQVLREAARRLPNSGPPGAFFDAADSISSDGEHAQVLMSLLQAGGLDSGTYVRIIRSASRLSSDGEKSRVLAAAAKKAPADDAVASAFVEAIGTISSDGEYRRVVSALLARGELGKKIRQRKSI